MVPKIKDWLRSNKKVVFLTFELFWIVIFLLELMTNENALEIPQFIYVNF